MPVDHANYLPQFLTKVVTQAGGKVWFKGPKGDWDVKFAMIHFDDYEAQVQLQQMPGCCAIMTMSYLAPRPYSQKNFLRTVQLIEEAAKLSAFGSVCLTQVCHGHDEKEPWALLLDNGYVKSPEFINAKSGNKVAYLTKDLGQTGQMDGFEEFYE
jgi:hypothetical protein